MSADVESKMGVKKKKLKVVLYWHMHQPEYRNLRTGVYRLPWTYLHAIKDYVDMVAHLEANPGAHAVINFSPTLLEQIEDYAQQVHGFLNDSTAIRDYLLAALVEPALPANTEQQTRLIKDCLRANEKHLIGRFPAYKRLADLAPWLQEHPDAMIYLEDQYLIDLLVWHHLAWIGETVKRNDLRIKRLLNKEKAYTLHDRRELLTVIDEILSSVIDRYRVLAERGQIELSVTPYAHPIMPLMLDIKSTHEAMPDAHMPLMEQYPGGEERVRWHLKKGVETFKRVFGFEPQGCWPSEGSVSEATLALLSEFGFKWTASGGSVLHNSLKKAEMLPENDESICIHHSYVLKETEVACFFRDDGLSDLIGFTYSDWHADDAVANFLHHLENIADACEKEPAENIVSIILDGENAWEHYPENGYYFLNALYKGLVDHPRLELTTYSRFLDKRFEKSLKEKPEKIPDEHSGKIELPCLVAGSWVYGTFSTWIGDTDKNRGWDMLGDAKHCYDRVVKAGSLNADQLSKAEHQLAICEGSDWFWWFGDYNSAESVSDFDSLYRQHLSHLYQLLGEEPPDYLSHAFSHGSTAPEEEGAVGGTMRPGQESG